MSDQLNNIERTLGRLEEGVGGINEHLRILNGKVVAHEKWINEQRGERRIMGIIGGFIGSIGTAIAIKIFKL